MSSEVGTRCALRAYVWHGPPPEIGDFLRTDAGSCYLIEDVTPTRPGSRSRYVLTCTRLERGAVELEGPGVWRWEFYSRERSAIAALDGNLRR